MKMIIVVALALVAATCAVEETKILRSDFQQSPDSGYNFGFETSDGTSRQETGEIKEALDEDKKPHKVVTVRGSYTYTDSNGQPESVNYFADETGYHAEGPSIPKPARR